MANMQTTPYDDAKELEFFSLNDLETVELMSAGMSEEEVLDYFALDLDELDKETDLKWFSRAFKRGRSVAKRKAVQKLFESMGDRNGSQASIAYLRHFGEKWPNDGSDASSSGKFSFNVVLD